MVGAKRRKPQRGQRFVRYGYPRSTVKSRKSSSRRRKAGNPGRRNRRLAARA